MVAGERTSACPGCGAVLPLRDGPTHAYLGASAACWALFGELLAGALSDEARQLAVDAYAAQHPGVPERRSIQSVGVHLVALSLLLVRAIAPDAAPALRARATGLAFHWLEPPPFDGRQTVADVLRAPTGARDRGVRAWADDVWDAWRDRHATVAGWVDELTPPAR